MNKEIKKIILWIVLVVIIVAFVFFYGYDRSSMSGDSMVVAKVNGKSIQLSEYKREYQYYQEMYKNQGSENNKELAKYIQQQALNAIVQRKFMLQMAQKYGIQPSNFEILVSVANMKDFRTEDGQFNEQMFRNTPPHYKRILEKQKREELAIQLLQVRIADAAKVTDAEIRDAFEINHTKAKIAYLFEPKEESLNTNLLTPLPVQNNRLEQAVELIKRGQGLYDVARALNLKAGNTGFFTFSGRMLRENSTNEYCTDIESGIDVHKNAFAMKKGQASGIINLSAGRCLIVVLDRQDPDWGKFYTDAENVRMQVLSQKMNDYFQQWFMTSIRDAKIQDYLTRLFGKN